MDPTEPPSTGRGPSAPASGRVLQGQDWLMVVAGLLFVCGAVYGMLTYGWKMLAAAGIGLGLSLMPWRAVALAGGVVMLGAGGYGLARGYAPLQPGLIIVLGLIAIAERMRR